MTIVYRVIIVICAIAIIILSFFYLKEKSNNKDDRQKELELKVEQLINDKKELERIYQLEVKNHIEEVEYLRTQTEKIKYIPYEKRVYPNRSLDSALSIISDYKYD